jgi:TonB family protein
MPVPMPTEEREIPETWEPDIEPDGEWCLGCTTEGPPSDGPPIGIPAGDGRGAAPVAAPAPVRIGGRIQAPRKIRHVAPAYPELARTAGVTGIVILECVIDPDGRVQSVQVLRGHPLLNEAALTAVRQWAYSPTLLNGVPVAVVMTVTVRFTTR